MAFKKGNIPWNKGVKGLYTKENNPLWKGGFPVCLTCNKLLANRSAKHCKSHIPITKKTRLLLSKAKMGHTAWNSRKCHKKYDGRLSRKDR